VKTVLLMGGGDGVGKLGNIAVEVANNLQKLDMKVHTIICVYLFICVYMYVCMYVCMYYICQYAYMHKCSRLTPTQSQLIVICGHNKKMLAQLSEKLQPTANLDVMIKGFVDNVDEFMTGTFTIY
jgi:UDP-N-acetylglucosamine:LPS N-acetylglucosamine transferase